MANKTLFRSIVGALLPRADMLNEAGGPAYAFSAEHALAQYAVTGCLNSTFYASDVDQLDRVLALCEAVEPQLLARVAIYARQQGAMKDLPALLCAVLSVREPSLLVRIFDRVIDSARMLRNFVQIMRSGAVGRKSLGSLPKRLVVRWLESQSEEQLFAASVGNDPSLADIIKMVHPKPAGRERQALYGYLIGGQYDASDLPAVVQAYEQFKSNSGNSFIPDVPFQLLTSLPLGPAEWTEIARNASWQTTRMNLNTFARHGVFENQEITSMVANRLRDAEQIVRAKAFPYQLMVAYTMATQVPPQVRDALQDAMEIALRNVPRVEGKVYVCLDVSGSMHSPVTGNRKGATTAVRCIDVAALVAAAVLRNNPQAEIIPFESKVVEVNLNPRDSVMTNAARLASLPCGGTNCSAPLKYLNDRKARGELVVYVSDNESWIDSSQYGRFGGSATETMRQWSVLKQRSPAATMVCIDIQPYGHTQAQERADIINVGGFSDQVFTLMAEVAAGRADKDHWLRAIHATSL